MEGAPDAAEASQSSGATTGNVAALTEYGFSVPDGATIDGVEVTLVGTGGSFVAPGQFMIFLWLDGFSGDQRDLTDDWAVSEVLGGPADGWNAFLAAEDVESSAFGVGFWNEGGIGSAQSLIDAVGIEVFYTGGSDPGGEIPLGPPTLRGRGAA